MELPHFAEHWWSRWVNLETGIPYWNPYGASVVLFFAIVIAFNLLAWMARAQKRRKPGFTFAKLRAEKEKAVKMRAAKARRIQHLESKRSSRF